ncbi:hypothetical protein [Pedobacter jeongneungensis]|uniref:rolling circle replication-associated protein n=1 Tax=Pedobacter jeongneungensis TaxID=947309 RepID=UPI0004680616|nr:hypothetical protein [Pedobacter jeongneungensis]
MILKQNCFVIAKPELTALLNGTYEPKQRYDNQINLLPYQNGDTLEFHDFVNPDYTTDLLHRGTTYIGSSLQRKSKKLSDFTKEAVYDRQIFPEPKKDSKEIEHVLSKKSKTKIANKITAWIRANKANGHKGMYNFITLTLTSKQIGTDKDFTKMLNVFFTYLRKYCGLKNYLYVLERQTKKTNNIHAHIIIDQYINYERCNSVWCKILGDNGYTFPSHDYVTEVTEQVGVNEAMRRYRSAETYKGNSGYVNPKTNKFVKPTKNINKPNPCDVETIYNLQAVSRYVTKYITKNESKIFTTVWNCSKNISRLWTGAIVCAKDYYATLREQTHRVITLSLDGGYSMFVNLLKYYTKTQEKIFEINKKIILENANC